MGDKMIEVEELRDSLFTLAHEIKNPLAVCKGYIEMFDSSNIIKSNKYINIIDNEISRALMILDDFMNLNRIQIDREVMDINMLLEDVRNMIEGLIVDKNVNINFGIIDVDVYIDGDYNKLKQVLINLIKNSIEAEANRIDVSLKINNDYVKIKIEDDGIGMSENILNNLGKLFFTTKDNGTGIGVNFSKEIIDLHGGNIKFVSESQKGTKVKIFLPLKKEMN